ncbi:MAG: hypothetical protein HS116_06915 [Planctomycetes bacterium]|nr:hypothetical protein [Planctomycetota bacterium]
MRSIHRTSPGWICAASFALLLAPVCPAAEPPAPEAPSPTPELKLEGPRDAPRVAKAIARTRLSEEQWQAEFEAMQKKYASWAQQRRRESLPDDLGRYLNDRLTILAFRAMSGDPAVLQEGALWLSFYAPSREPLPGIVTAFAEEHRDSINRVLEAFTWERAAAYVKAKQWAKDAEAKRKKK